MRKLLRNNKHIGEFREYAVYLIIRFDRASRNFDDFLDAFISETVEANHCYTAAGGHVEGETLEGIVELGTEREFRERLAAIQTWVLAQPDVMAHRFSPLTDIWYGPWYDFGETISPVVSAERV